MRKQLLLIPLLIAILVMAVGSAAAQVAGPVTATLSVPAGQFTVGDPLKVTLAVSHPAGYQVITPQIAEKWGDFTVVSVSPATITANQDGTETTSVVIDARLFRPGDFNTPPLELTVTDGQGGLSKVTAEPAPVTIASVLTEGDSELRDIKPQAELSMPPVWLWIVAGLLGVIAVAGLIVWQRSRREKVLVDNRLPHEKALDELAGIEAMQLPQQGRFKEHYTLVSNTVRTYAERQFRIPALERTTGEIQSDLKAVDIIPEVKALFISFLNESDLIKFSRFTPDVESADRLLAQGRMIVEATRPQPAAGEPDAKAPAKGERKVRNVAANSDQAHLDTLRVADPQAEQ